MTEYTGWDNYLKEQEKLDKILSGAPKDPMETDWIPVILELRHKVKDLETKIDYDRIILDNFANSIDELRKKLKDLEDLTKELSKFTDTLNNQIVLDVGDRITTLEKWHNQHEDYGEKIKALEEHRSIIYHEGRKHEKRIKDLEEWKQWANQAIAEHTHSASEMSDNKSLIKFKIIDKKVWESIKSHVSGLNMGIIRNRGTREGDEMFLNALVDAIKKADPTWCPND